MFEHLTLYVQNSILPLGALGVFTGSIIEEVIAVIPSYIVQMGGGFLLMGVDPINLTSILKLFMLVILPASIGVTIGSIFVYYLVLKGGEPVVRKFGWILGVSWESIELFVAKQRKRGNDTLIVFIFRTLPFIPSVVVCAYAGIIGMSMTRYMVLTFFGTLIRAAVLGFAGWQTGIAYEKYGKEIQNFEHIGLYIIGFIVVLFIFLRFRKNRLNK